MTKAGSIVIESIVMLYNISILQVQKSQAKQIHSKTNDDPIFDSNGITYIHLIPRGQIVNKQYNVEVLKEFSKRPKLFGSGEWRLHQDNAPCHKCVLVTQYLADMGIKTVPHIFDSSNLAPCDFWMFPELKKKLNGFCFEDVGQMKIAVTSFLSTFTKENYKMTVKK